MFAHSCFPRVACKESTMGRGHKGSEIRRPSVPAGSSRYGGERKLTAQSIYVISSIKGYYGKKILPNICQLLNLTRRKCIKMIMTSRLICHPVLPVFSPDSWLVSYGRSSLVLAHSQCSFLHPVLARWGPKKDLESSVHPRSKGNRVMRLWSYKRQCFSKRGLQMESNLCKIQRQLSFYMK